MTFEYVRSLHSCSLVDWGAVQVAGAVMLKTYGPLPPPFCAMVASVAST